MDVKRLGERLRIIRKHLGIKQQQLAEATKLTQPAISRLENGEEVYSSALLAILAFYRDKINLDSLFDPDLDLNAPSHIYCHRNEIRQQFDRQLADIAHELDKSREQIAMLRSQIQQ